MHTCFSGGAHEGVKIKKIKSCHIIGGVQSNGLGVLIFFINNPTQVVPRLGRAKTELRAAVNSATYQGSSRYEG